MNDRPHIRGPPAVCRDTRARMRHPARRLSHRVREGCAAFRTGLPAIACKTGVTAAAGAILRIAKGSYLLQACRVRN